MKKQSMHHRQQLMIMEAMLVSSLMNNKIRMPTSMKEVGSSKLLLKKSAPMALSNVRMGSIFTTRTRHVKKRVVIHMILLLAFGLVALVAQERLLMTSHLVGLHAG